MAQNLFWGASDIVNLNVGGTHFATSRQTLTWVPDSFFSSMLSGRISTLRDEKGAIFIDRDPKLFSIILNFMRTKDLDLRETDPTVLRHEAEYYGITPLVKRLTLCEDLDHSSCGDVLFHGYLPASPIPLAEPLSTKSTSERKESARLQPEQCQNLLLASSTTGPAEARPGSVFRVLPETPVALPGHSRTASFELRTAHSTLSRSSSDLRSMGRGHSRASSLDMRHSQNSSADLTKTLRGELGLFFGGQGNNIGWSDPLRVRIVRGHQNWVAVAYAHFIACYRNYCSINQFLYFLKAGNG